MSRLLQGCFLITFFYSSLVFTTPSHLKHPSSSLPPQLTQLLKRTTSSAHVGIMIKEVGSGKTIFSYAGDALFNPASVQKLFTAIAALHYLGPQYQFHTELWIHGKIRRHTLYGNLTVKFSGDPQLTSRDLTQLIAQLESTGIRKIKGQVQIDSSDYGFPPYPAGWLWDDLSYGYAAPADAIIINENKFLLHLRPLQLGKPPSLIIDLPMGVAQFINQVRIIPHADKTCPLTIYSDLDNHYRVSGCLNKAWGQQRRTLAVRNPFFYAETLIQLALDKTHIQYKGAITEHAANTGAYLLGSHGSPPLGALIKKMLKTSDNLITNSLLSKIGHLYFQKPGTCQNGLLAMQRILSGTQINFKKNRLNDGAGLSRYNLVSPAQIIQLLQFAYKNPSIRSSLFKALPVGGHDGTLTYRMHRLHRASQRIHAKTGSMTGVSALAGYVKTQRHGTLAFAILINDFVGKDRPYVRLEDHICELLVRNL